MYVNKYKTLILFSLSIITNKLEGDVQKNNIGQMTSSVGMSIGREIASIKNNLTKLVSVPSRVSELETEIETLKTRTLKLEKITFIIIFGLFLQLPFAYFSPVLGLSVGIFFLFINFLIFFEFISLDFLNAFVDKTDKNKEKENEEGRKKTEEKQKTPRKNPSTNLEKAEERRKLLAEANKVMTPSEP